MALLQDERSAFADGELLLSDGPLPVRCRVTVEWLRGIQGPTWYGYFVSLDDDLSVLPGRYRVRLQEQSVEVLVRRPCLLSGALSFPFWGLDQPPELPANEDDDDVDEEGGMRDEG
jgi:hypothetical protein